MPTASPLELSTEMLNALRISAGKLDRDGITLTPRAIEAKNSPKFGEFFILSGMLEGGREVELSFSSAKLRRLLADNWVRLVGRRINICGVGINYDREYIIRTVG